jgi:hypothetical protein
VTTCLYYWLIEPVRDIFLDTSESVPAFEVPIMFKEKQYVFAMFVDNAGLPEYARLTIPDLNDNEIPESLLPMIQTVREHCLAILRITYQPDVNLFPRPFWTFQDDITAYTMGLEISRIREQMLFDHQRTRRLFIGSFDFRDELRLFIDGFDNRIPLQYRYLSLFKILEMYYRTNDEWLESDLQNIIQPYESDFLDIGVRQKPLKHLHAIRDKCAHIKTRGKRKTLGVTQLNHKEYKEVQQVLPILSKICVAAINQRAAGKFTITPLSEINP